MQHVEPVRPYIAVHDNDVLSGRGVNISQHPGNERFRTLIKTHFDENYCQAYSTYEKRAVAERIIDHIKSSNPPGRFLKRLGKSRGGRGLDGPWEELTTKETIKKTCQALRDCNRPDRAGYAEDVAVPDDVRRNALERERAGLTNRTFAQRAAAQAKQRAATAPKRSASRTAPAYIYGGGPISPSVENGATAPAPHFPTVTPSTSTSSSGLQQEPSGLGLGAPSPFHQVAYQGQMSSPFPVAATPSHVAVASTAAALPNNVPLTFPIPVPYQIASSEQYAAAAAAQMVPGASSDEWDPRPIRPGLPIQQQNLAPLALHFNPHGGGEIDPLLLVAEATTSIEEVPLSAHPHLQHPPTHAPPPDHVAYAAPPSPFNPDPSLT